MRRCCLLLPAVLIGVPLGLGSPQSGTVSGRVEMKPIAPRTAVSRYPSPGGPLQGTIDPIPTAVFIDGPVAGAPAWPKSAAIIAQRHLRFSPSLLVIPRGTSVSFPNEDSEFHNVFSYSEAKRFDLGRYPKGESKRVTFDKPGIVKTYCEVHPWMRAAIVVLESSCYAIASEDGSFSIGGIPPGRYSVVAWNIDAGSKKMVVEVTAGRAQELQIRLDGRFEAAAAEQDIPVDALAVMATGSADHLPKEPCCAGRR
jgi:plastocyanin